MLRQVRRVVVRTVATGTVVLGALEVTTHLPTQGRSSQFYHSLSDDYVTPFLRTWLDPETAHWLAIEFAKRNWSPKHHISSKQVDLSIAPQFRNQQHSLQFDNCVGLAAGFDKDGVVIQPMLDLGFGFVEIGSVTPKPQPGNAKPRMFRLTKEQGIINRYGFNSLGVEVVQENLQQYHCPKQKETVETKVASDGDDSTETTLSQKVINLSVKGVKLLFNTVISLASPKPRPLSQGIVGVNLGKNKDSPDEIADYQYGIRHLGPHADYLVVNISSPNTPGLRNLQQAESLVGLLEAVVKERDLLPPRQYHDNDKFRPPLFVKLAPDMNDDELTDAVQTIMDCKGIDGIVVTNTTTSRPNIKFTASHKSEAGGLSGAPIRDLSTECIKKVYRITRGRIPIIGVGGVGSGHDAYEKLRAGASLVQVYSMMVYKGPGVVSKIRQELSELMKQNGHSSVSCMVGLDHDDIYWEKRKEQLLQKQQQLLKTNSNENKTQNLASQLTVSSGGDVLWDETKQESSSLVVPTKEASPIDETLEQQGSEKSKDGNLTSGHTIITPEWEVHEE